MVKRLRLCRDAIQDIYQFLLNKRAVAWIAAAAGLCGVQCGPGIGRQSVTKRRMGRLKVPLSGALFQSALTEAQGNGVGMT